MQFDCRTKSAIWTAFVLHSFQQIERVEWDTMLFFFGVIFAVAGLGFLGYLALVSQFLYVDLGPTTANRGWRLVSGRRQHPGHVCNIENGSRDAT